MKPSPSSSLELSGRWQKTRPLVDSTQTREANRTIESPAPRRTPTLKTQSNSAGGSTSRHSGHRPVNASILTGLHSLSTAARTQQSGRYGVHATATKIVTKNQNQTLGLLSSTCRGREIQRAERKLAASRTLDGLGLSTEKYISTLTDFDTEMETFCQLYTLLPTSPES